MGVSGVSGSRPQNIKCSCSQIISSSLTDHATIEAQHGGGLNLISECGQLIFTKHVGDQREHTLGRSRGARHHRRCGEDRKISSREACRRFPSSCTEKHCERSERSLAWCSRDAGVPTELVVLPQTGMIQFRKKLDVRLGNGVTFTRGARLHKSEHTQISLLFRRVATSPKFRKKNRETLGRPKPTPGASIHVSTRNQAQSINPPHLVTFISPLFCPIRGRSYTLSLTLFRFFLPCVHTVCVHFPL